MDCWIDVEGDIYGEDPSGTKMLLVEADEFHTACAKGVECRESLSSGPKLAVPHSVREVVIDPVDARRHRQSYLVVRENQKWPRVLAVAELLSPANKSGSYAQTYNAKRARMLASRTHFMEIDLLRGGSNPLRQQFSELAPTAYFAFVARKSSDGRKEEGYPIWLQDPLPTIGLPVWGERPDLPLDLAEAFRSAHFLTTGGRPIQYQTELVPEPALSPEDDACVTKLLATIR